MDILALWFITHGGYDMDAIPLADLLIELRRELEQARREGERQGLHFRVETIDVDLQVTVSKSGEVGAGFKFWVVAGDAKGKIAAESLQRLHLKLDPHVTDASGNQVSLDIGDERDLGAPHQMDAPG